MDILVIALSINPRPLSALEVKLSSLIMESRVDTAGDNLNAHVIISNYQAELRMFAFRDRPNTLDTYHRVLKATRSMNQPLQNLQPTDCAVK